MRENRGSRIHGVKSGQLFPGGKKELRKFLWEKNGKTCRCGEKCGCLIL